MPERVGKERRGERKRKNRTKDSQRVKGGKVLNSYMTSDVPKQKAGVRTFQKHGGKRVMQCQETLAISAVKIGRLNI